MAIRYINTNEKEVHDYMVSRGSALTIDPNKDIVIEKKDDNAGWKEYDFTEIIDGERHTFIIL